MSKQNIFCETLANNFLLEVKERSRKSQIIKKEAEVSEDDLPPPKRSKNATTTKSRRKGSDGSKSSDEDIAPERRLPPVDSPKTTTKKGKDKVGANTPASPLKALKALKATRGVKPSSASPPAVSKSGPKATAVEKSPVLPCQSTDSELSLPEAPSTKSRMPKLGPKAKTARKSPPKSSCESTDSELSLSRAPLSKSKKPKPELKATTAKKQPSIPPRETTDSELSLSEAPLSRAKRPNPKPKARTTKKQPSTPPRETADSELSLSEAPLSKHRRSESKPKARTAERSPPVSSRESTDAELSLSGTALRKSKKLKNKSEAGTAKKSSTGRKAKKRVVVSDTEAADKPEGSATRKALGSDSETEKPSLAPAAGREMIKKLSKSVPPAYPDWVAGKPTPYAALVTTFNLLESTTKRLEKISHASRFLRQVLRLSPDELLLVIHLMINKLAADFEGVEMGIGESLLMKAIGESCGRSMERVREDQRECGDLGLVAMKSRSKQLTLFPPQALTIAVVHNGLLSIAKVKGEGGQGRKVSAIRKLLAAAQGDEAKFLIRGLEGKLRLGLADRTVLVSLSSAMITHEQELSGKMPTTAMLDQSELNLRSVYRFVTIDGL